MSRGLHDTRRTGSAPKPAVRLGRGARGTLATTGLVVVMLGAALGGCGDDDRVVDRAAPATTPGPTATSSVAELERFAAVTIPDEATDVDVQSWTNDLGFQVYRAQFTATEDDARAFCTSGMGGARVLAAGLDEQTRQNFNVPADETGDPLTCRSTNPSDRSVQREALIIVAEDGTATVRLNAYEVGR